VACVFLKFRQAVVDKYYEVQIVSQIRSTMGLVKVVD
jgi:hypothetical protein